MARLVIPGDFLSKEDDKHKRGPFTHTSSNEIRSSCLGHLKTTVMDNGQFLIEVVPLKQPGVVPTIGSTVLAKVTSLTRRVVRCDVVAVGDCSLAGPFKGLIRREDIRATQRDQAEPAQCFRPGDLIRAKVINMVGPGTASESISIPADKLSSQGAETLLAARAVSESVGATCDASTGSSSAVCLLSTAEPDLGVVLGLGRAPKTPLVELLGCTGGAPLIPVAWTEMICPYTLTRFSRKVARVPDELLTQLVHTMSD
ncbi:unnamed protein product [Calicophoron daubneyi]|uniref:Exosome complex component CSL4 C-terminal domain-containing protein n=1 Tax=Calicophoron daubneyi TaxID=300641 RepID=A0AAV2TPA8_CALDB